MTEDLVNAMKELIRCYDRVNNPYDPVNKEINMWRNRFLSAQPKLESAEKGAKVWSCFLFSLSDDMINEGPEILHRQIKEAFHESQ